MKALVALALCVAHATAQMPYGLVPPAPYDVQYGYQGPYTAEFYGPQQFRYRREPPAMQMQVPMTGESMMNPVATQEYSGPAQAQQQQPEQTQQPPQMMTYPNALLTLEELARTPLFQEYVTLPLFRHYLPSFSFQRFLASPLFQKYWTSPVFQQLFREPVLFYKYIYPAFQQFQAPEYPAQQYQAEEIEPEQYQAQQIVPQQYQAQQIVPQQYQAQQIVPQQYQARQFQPQQYQQIMPAQYQQIMPPQYQQAQRIVPQQYQAQQIVPQQYQAQQMMMPPQSYQTYEPQSYQTEEQQQYTAAAVPPTYYEPRQQVEVPEPITEEVDSYLPRRAAFNYFPRKFNYYPLQNTDDLPVHTLNNNNMMPNTEYTRYKFPARMPLIPRQVPVVYGNNDIESEPNYVSKPATPIVYLVRPDEGRAPISPMQNAVVTRQVEIPIRVLKVPAPRQQLNAEQFLVEKILKALFMPSVAAEAALEMMEPAGPVEKDEPSFVPELMTEDETSVEKMEAPEESVEATPVKMTPPEKAAEVETESKMAEDKTEETMVKIVPLTTEDSAVVPEEMKKDEALVVTEVTTEAPEKMDILKMITANKRFARFNKKPTGLEKEKLIGAEERAINYYRYDTAEPSQPEVTVVTVHKRSEDMAPLDYKTTEGDGVHSVPLTRDENSWSKFPEVTAGNVENLKGNDEDQSYSVA